MKLGKFVISGCNNDLEIEKWQMRGWEMIDGKSGSKLSNVINTYLTVNLLTAEAKLTILSINDCE